MITRNGAISDQGEATDNHLEEGIWAIMEPPETLAIFIDVSNSYRYVDYARLLREMATHGRIIEKSAFADFNRPGLEQVQRVFLTCGVRMVHVPSFNNGNGWKSFDDQWLVMEVRDCLEKFPQINTYVLVSGDGHFVPLVASLHDRGKRVIVVAGEKALSSLLKEALTEDDGLRLGDCQTVER